MSFTAREAVSHGNAGGEDVTKSRPIQRISVFLFKDQVATLRAIHEATGVPASILIRQGVDWAIQQHAQPKAKWVVKRRPSR